MDSSPFSSIQGMLLSHSENVLLPDLSLLFLLAQEEQEVRIFCPSFQ